MEQGRGWARAGESDVESYWALVSEVAPRLRLIDPSARIVVGAVAGRDLDWIRELATSPGFEEMVDGISIHPLMVSRFIHTTFVTVPGRGLRTY